jgi:hypothetical protein
MKFGDDFFETAQDPKTRPKSMWQLLAHFVTPNGETPRSQGAKSASGRSSTSRAPPVASHESLTFDFVDQGEPEGNDDAPEVSVPAALTHVGELVPDKPPDPEQHRHPESACRSSRQSAPSPPRCLIETACLVLDDTEAVEDYETQREAEDRIVFAASKLDPDTMHYGEAMRAADTKEFKQAMLKEVEAHTSKGHWEVWAKLDVPLDQDVLPAFWAFRRKRPPD